MKSIFFSILTVIALFTVSCSSNQSSNNSEATITNPSAKIENIVKEGQSSLPLQTADGLLLTSLSYDGTYYTQTIEIEVVEGEEETTYNQLLSNVEPQKQETINQIKSGAYTVLCPALKEAKAGMKTTLVIKGTDKKVEIVVEPTELW